MSRRSQQSLLNSLEKARAGPVIPDPEEIWSAVLCDFYYNLHHWHTEWRKNPLPEQLILRIDLQLRSFEELSNNNQPSGSGGIKYVARSRHFHLCLRQCQVC
jgi:hypothetical protein